MSNNKQSSIEYYCNNLIEILGDEICNNLTIEQTNKIHFLDNQAKAMHKEEMEHFFKGGMSLVEGRLWKPIDMFDEYYNETFGGNNEQQ